MRLREADGEELHRLLEEHAERLTVPEARQALRNPFLERDGVERLAAQTRLLPSYDVKRLIALHPRTPETLARQLVGSLYWRDLMTLGRDARVRPTVRRVADRQLLTRLPKLAAGEKVALARLCSAAVVERLRHDPDRRVMAALLGNPRLTEGALLPLLASDAARPQILAQVARDRRWGNRHRVRLALVRNPRTPTAVALPLLSALRKHDLRELVRDRRAPAPVRRRAKLLLGQG